MEWGKLNGILTTIFVLMITLNSLGKCAVPNFVRDSNWPKKGCHKVGHMHTVRTPGCENVEVLLNGCRGNCPSYAVPSLDSPLKTTSYSLCCRMTKHEEVSFLVSCTDGIRELKFPSATECNCFDCNHHLNE